jgi:3-oxoacyl-[acyl-carrier protein] reductase
VLQKLRFNDDVVIVTGAAGGIGRATAEALAELGATTVLVGRTQAKLEEVKAALDKTGAKSNAFAADVSKEADVARLRDFVKQRWGGRRRWSTMPATISSRPSPTSRRRSGTS